MKRKFAWALPAIFALSAGVSALTAHADVGAALNQAEAVLVTDLYQFIESVLFNQGEPINVTDVVSLVPVAQVNQPEPVSVSDKENFLLSIQLTVPEAITVTDTLPDTTPPTVTLTGKPANPTSSNQAVFTWTIADPDNASGFASFCKLDGGSFGPCTSGVTYTQLADGQHTFTVQAADPAGNRSPDVSSTWLVDSTPPTIQCQTPDTAWHAANLSYTCTASDSGSGLANPSDAGFTLATSVPAGTETANASTGSHQVCDLAGNCATAGPISGSKIDLKAPAISATAVTAGDGKPYTGGTWTNQSVTISFACSDGGSGVNSSTVTLPVTLGGEGKDQSATGSCADNVGNTASTTFMNIDIDKTPPTIAFQGQSPKANASGWNNTSVTLTWGCADSLSGPAAATVSATIATEGTNQSASGTCIDKAGNTATDTQAGINIDETPPVLKASAATADGKPYVSGTWTNQTVTVTFNCTDSLSGVASVTAPVTISTEGANQSATGNCVDNAGNGATPAIFGGIDIDKTPPTITYQGQSPKANAKGWNNTSVTLTWGCADSLSGATAATVGALLTSEGVNQSATGTCTDNAGNTASNTQTGIKIDKTPPVLSASATTADGKPYVSGTWTNQNVTVTFNCTDSLSGVASVTGPVTISTEGANQSAAGNCMDNAGNAAAPATFGGIDIDKSSPTTSFTSQPGPLNGRQLVTTTANVTMQPGGITFTATCYDSFGVNAVLSASDTLDPVAAILYGSSQIVQGQALPNPPLTNTFSGSSGTVPFLTSGAYVLNFAAVDQAGNQEGTQTRWIFVNSPFGTACVTTPVPLSSLPTPGTVMVMGTIQVGDRTVPIIFTFTYTATS